MTSTTAKPRLQRPTSFEDWAVHSVPSILNAVSSLEFAPVLVNGKRHSALVDNQASANIMSLGFALQRRLPFQRFKLDFTLADGSIQSSLGLVVVRLQVGRKILRSCMFYVFKTAMRPLILGRPVLQQIDVLRLPTTLQDPTAVAMSDRLHELQSFVRIHLSTQDKKFESYAVPDIAAHGNAVSLDFAVAFMGFQMASQREKGESGFIRIGDGRRVQTRGSIEITMDFGKGLNQQDCLGRCRFTVVKGLPFDLVLGRSMVKRHNMLNHGLSHVDWVHTPNSRLYLCSTGRAKAKYENVDKKGWVVRLRDVFSTKKREQRMTRSVAEKSHGVQLYGGMKSPYAKIAKSRPSPQVPVQRPQGVLFPPTPERSSEEK